MLSRFSRVQWTAAHQAPLSMEHSMQEYLNELQSPSPPRRHRWQKKEVTGLPWWLSSAEFTCKHRRHGFNPWSQKIPHVWEQLSLRATLLSLCPRAQDPHYWSLRALEPMFATREAITMRSPHTTTREWAPLTATRETTGTNEDWHSQK